MTIFSPNAVCLVRSKVTGQPVLVAAALLVVAALLEEVVVTAYCQESFSVKAWQLAGTVACRLFPASYVVVELSAERYLY